MASEDIQQGDQERSRQNGERRGRQERENPDGDDSKREWGPRESSGGEFARRDTKDTGREGAGRFPGNRDVTGGPGGRDAGERGADERSEGPRREHSFRSRSDREGGAPARREFPRRDEPTTGDAPRQEESGERREGPGPGARRESFGERREGFGERRESFGERREGFGERREGPGDRRENFDRPRRDDYGAPRREPYGAREGGRPPYRPGMGTQRGTGGAYRPKGPRPPMKKKKKARVYFHQALTRILLPKLLTKAKYLSPALARQFIEAGRVRVNARVVSSRYYEVNLRKERVTIDEAATEYPRRLSYMVYNKPVGVVCEKGDAAFDALFDPTCTWSFPFGRLAKPVSGLVIVSNDPRMVSTQHFMDVELQKEYRLRLNKHLTDEQIEELRGGILVGEDYLVPLKVTPGAKNSHSMWIDLTLLDDSYQRIYGALKALGAEVVKMRRTRIALLNENMIPPGEWRELSGFEVSALALSRFMPGELPPEPLPPPRPRIERPKTGRFSRDARGGRDGGRDMGRDAGRGGDRFGGERGGGDRGGWDRRPGGPGAPGGAGGPGGPGARRYPPQRRREEDPDEREERLRQEAIADAIGNK